MDWLLTVKRTVLLGHFFNWTVTVFWQYFWPFYCLFLGQRNWRATFVRGLFVRGSRILVGHVVIRFSASLGANTTSSTGTKELQNKSLAGPCIRGAEKFKIDVAHRYPRTGYQRTENKVVRWSAIKRLKVLTKERQSAVEKVTQGNRFFTVKSRFFPRFSFSPG